MDMEGNMDNGDMGMVKIDYFKRSILLSEVLHFWLSVQESFLIIN